MSLLNFWIPDGRLELVVAAHSIDFGTKGYANLVELADLQHRVASELKVPVGRLLMSVRSAHIYDPEIETMRATCTAGSSSTTAPRSRSGRRSPLPSNQPSQRRPADGIQAESHRVL